jgi:large-conductance mechanosensitive channel
MYGALARNGAYALFGALFAAVVREIITPLIGALGPEAQGSAYLRGIQAVSDNVLLIIILGCVFGVITRAIVERRVSGGI